jgi:hypothetical protein
MTEIKKSPTPLSSHTGAGLFGNLKKAASTVHDDIEKLKHGNMAQKEAYSAFSTARTALGKDVSYNDWSMQGREKAQKSPDGKFDKRTVAQWDSLIKQAEGNIGNDVKALKSDFQNMESSSPELAKASAAELAQVSLRMMKSDSMLPNSAEDKAERKAVKQLIKASEKDFEHLQNGTPTQKKAYNDFQAARKSAIKDLTYEKWASDGLQKAKASSTGSFGGRNQAEWSHQLDQARGAVGLDVGAERAGVGAAYASSTALRNDAAQIRKTFAAPEPDQNKKTVK